MKKIKQRNQPVISKIHQRLRLDYFDIDCSIDEEMNILIFEINPAQYTLEQIHPIWDHQCGQDGFPVLL